MNRSRIPRSPRLTADMSPCPVIVATPEYRKAAKDLENMESRIERGCELLLLHVAKAFIQDLAKFAPEIAGLDYKKDLRVGLLQNVPDMESAVAVYLEGRTSSLGDSEKEKTTALWFGVREDSPQYVNVLSAWSPWPATLVPFVVSKSDADVIARTVTEGEIKEVSERIGDNRDRIEMEFARSGRPVRIAPGDAAIGTDIRLDIGHSVLRHELGIMERPSPHWGKALKNIRKNVRELQRMFVKYMETGSESAFDLPDVGEKITTADLQKSRWFSSRIKG